MRVRTLLIAGILSLLLGHVHNVWKYLEGAGVVVKDNFYYQLFYDFGNTGSLVIAWFIIYRAIEDNITRFIALWMALWYMFDLLQMGWNPHKYNSELSEILCFLFGLVFALVWSGFRKLKEYRISIGGDGIFASRRHQQIGFKIKDSGDKQ